MKSGSAVRGSPDLRRTEIRIGASLSIQNEAGTWIERVVGLYGRPVGGIHIEIESVDYGWIENIGPVSELGVGSRRESGARNREEQETEWNQNSHVAYMARH